MVEDFGNEPFVLRRGQDWSITLLTDDFSMRVTSRISESSWAMSRHYIRDENPFNTSCERSIHRAASPRLNIRRGGKQSSTAIVSRARPRRSRVGIPNRGEIEMLIGSIIYHRTHHAPVFRHSQSFLHIEVQRHFNPYSFISFSDMDASTNNSPVLLQPSWGTYPPKRLLPLTPGSPLSKLKYRDGVTVLKLPRADAESLRNTLRDLNFRNITNQELYEARIKEIPVLLHSVGRFECSAGEKRTLDEVVRKYAVKVRERTGVAERTTFKTYRYLLIGNDGFTA